MGQMLDLACACGYTASVIEGELTLGESVLRRCNDCIEIVSVITTVDLDADAPAPRINDLLAMRGRCPRCRGKDLSKTGGRLRGRNDVQCPRCRSVLHEQVRGIVE